MTQSNPHQPSIFRSDQTIELNHRLLTALAINLPSPIQRVNSPRIKRADLTLDIKRDDLIHPIISGNKWRKLKGLVTKYGQKKAVKIAAMGGRYSNFLHSLAFIANQLDWQCEFFVRGYQGQAVTPTLADILRWKSAIHYIDREGFKHLRNNPPTLQTGVEWLTEGGLDELAMQGFVEMIAELESNYDYIIIASATGTSVAGLVKGVRSQRLKTQVIGIAVLNNQLQQQKNIEFLSGKSDPCWQVKTGYEFGGFAKFTPCLDQFSTQFTADHNLPLEPVYSAKSFYATMDLIDKGFFPLKSRILLIHCGGLQGARSQ